MPVLISILAVFFGHLYLKKAPGNYLRESILFSIMVYLVNVLIDLPLFLFGGPMQTNFGGYISDIGLTYLIYPIVIFAQGLAYTHKTNFLKAEVTDNIVE